MNAFAFVLSILAVVGDTVSFVSDIFYICPSTVIAESEIVKSIMLFIIGLLH
jgi:hypothetical protein